jgi:hypothetical protein
MEALDRFLADNDIASFEFTSVNYFYLNGNKHDILLSESDGSMGDFLNELDEVGFNFYHVSLLEFPKHLKKYFNFKGKFKHTMGHLWSGKYNGYIFLFLFPMNNSGENPNDTVEIIVDM